MSARRITGTMETITVGPFPIFFCNTNTTMKLKGHCHAAAVTVTFRTSGATGYPSFLATNAAIRQHLKETTGVEHPFRDSTNEDVVRNLFNGLAEFRPAEWEEWDGAYELEGVDLDVVGVDDQIGHDPGVTRYTVRRNP
jgi:hypothetical protein